MGWSSGHEIGIAVVKAVKKHVKDPDARRAIYKPFIQAMEDNDWDSQQEVVGIDKVFDDLVSNEEE